MVGYGDSDRSPPSPYPLALRRRRAFLMGTHRVGILDGCLHHRTPYSEDLAWAVYVDIAA